MYKLVIIPILNKEYSVQLRTALNDVSTIKFSVTVSEIDLEETVIKVLSVSKNLRCTNLESNY